MAQIETIYKAVVYYEADDLDAKEAIENRAFSWEIKGLKVETMGGNAACSPYVMVEGDLLSEVKHFVEKLERYIIRKKGTQLLGQYEQVC